ncbi:MAG: NnrS family protein [Bdellovibrionaceae bacterium]|nr:NnrS family protein [Pseudobdellovibrionaceae bacterium]
MALATLHPGGRTYCRLVAEGEPFRLLFPLGTAIGVFGVLLWPAHAWGWLSAYPATPHARIMIEGFLTSFVLGFLGTSLPRLLGAPPVQWGETLGFAGAVVVLTALHACGETFSGDQMFLLTLLMFTGLLGIRLLLFRRDVPPAGLRPRRPGPPLRPGRRLAPTRRPCHGLLPPPGAAHAGPAPVAPGLSVVARHGRRRLPAAPLFWAAGKTGLSGIRHPAAGMAAPRRLRVLLRRGGSLGLCPRIARCAPLGQRPAGRRGSPLFPPRDPLPPRRRGRRIPRPFSAGRPLLRSPLLRPDGGLAAARLLAAPCPLHHRLQPAHLHRGHPRHSRAQRPIPPVPYPPRARAGPAGPRLASHAHPRQRRWDARCPDQPLFLRRPGLDHRRPGLGRLHPPGGAPARRALLKYAGRP